MATDLTEPVRTDPRPRPRLLIVTVGGPGDVLPFTGLGAALREAGSDVAVATHDTFGDVVRASGFAFRPLPENPMRLGVGDGEGKAPPTTDMRAVEERIRETGRAILRAAAEGTDLLLLHHAVVPLGWHVAEGLGLPSLGAYLTPHGPTAALPPHYFGRSLGAAGNLAAWRAVEAAGDRFLVAKAAAALREDMGLAPLSPRRMRRRRDQEAWPICCGYSPALVPRPRDWRPGVEAVGYWWPAPPEGWAPPPALTDFLAAGPPPVYVGFGTLGGDAERLAAVVPEALRRARVRAVVQGDWAAEAAGDDLLAVGDVPHAWLFPQVAAVVHAAGAGVTGAGLRAGVPAVPVPLGLDQPFWAGRLVACGVAPVALPGKAVTADALADGLRAALEEPRYRTRASEVGAVVAAEDGAARTVDTLRRLVRATVPG